MVNSTGSRYWSLGGYEYYALKLRGKSVNEDGIWNNNSEDLNSSYGIRPVIALKPTAQIKLGTDGTALNPYEIE